MAKMGEISGVFCGGIILRVDAIDGAVGVGHSLFDSAGSSEKTVDRVVMYLIHFFVA